MDSLLLLKSFAVTQKIFMTINRKFTVIIVFILKIVEQAHTKSYQFQPELLNQFLLIYS